MTGRRPATERPAAPPTSLLTEDEGQALLARADHDDLGVRRPGQLLRGLDPPPGEHRGREGGVERVVVVLEAACLDAEALGLLPGDGQAEDVLGVDLLLGHLGFDGVRDPLGQRDALDRNGVDVHEAGLEVRLRHHADALLDRPLGRVDLLGFVLSEHGPDDRPHLRANHDVHVVGPDALVQERQGVRLKVVARRVLHLHGEAVHGQDVDGVGDSLLADVVEVHPVDRQDDVHAFAVHGVDLRAATQPPPQHAELAGGDRDHRAIEEEDDREAQEGHGEDEVDRLAPGEGTCAVPGAGRCSSRFHSPIPVTSRAASGSLAASTESAGGDRCMD